MQKVDLWIISRKPENSQLTKPIQVTISAAFRRENGGKCKIKNVKSFPFDKPNPHPSLKNYFRNFKIDETQSAGPTDHPKEYTYIGFLLECEGKVKTGL